MDVHVRGIAPEEHGAYWRVVFTAVSTELTEEQEADAEVRVDADRMLGAFEGDRIVGTAGAFGFDLTLPGGATVPVSGLTAVGVLPTHRRRGVLAAMMAHHLADTVERGEPIAVLTASESAIYGRFGYGLATRAHHVRVDTTGGLQARVAPPPGDRMRLADRDEAAAVLPGLYDLARRGRHGSINRTEGMWAAQAFDREVDREGASAFFAAVHLGPDGEVDGVVRWRVKQGEWSKAEVFVIDLYGADPEVELALWHFVADIDLTATLTAYRPVDDPLRYALADWRRYKVLSSIDLLYVRVLDVERVLSARTYGCGPSALTLRVDDPFRAESGGTFALEVDGDGAGTCRRVDAEPDLLLDATALGSISLGDVAPSTLAAVGRLQAANPAALAVADRLFTTPVPPYCSTEF